MSQTQQEINARKVNSKRFPNGNLYIIRLQGLDIYKFGVSQNIKRRMRDLQSSNPFTINILYSQFYKEVYHLEDLVFKTFKENIIKGEWFNAYEEDVIKLISVLTELNIKENASNTNI